MVAARSRAAAAFERAIALTVGSVADAADSHIAAELGDDLPARAARGDGARRSACRATSATIARRAVGDRAEDRVAFGADRQAERGILDVAAAAIAPSRQHRGTDGEVAVPAVGALARDARRVGQLLPMLDGEGAAVDAVHEFGFQVPRWRGCATKNRTDSHDREPCARRGVENSDCPAASCAGTICR